MAEHRRAFGLDLCGDVSLPGCDAPPARGRPSLELTRATRAQVLGPWPEREAADVMRRRSVTGRTALLIASHPGTGILQRADGFGCFRIEPGARRVLCAPLSSAPVWREHRFLAAQVLPFAAVLRGIEGLHAGAAAIGDGAVVVAAASGGGKTTLVAELVERGARLVADDVAAVESDGDTVVVHPGPGLMSVRDDAGPPLRRVAREPRSLPLRAVVLLRRGDGARRLALREVPPDPRVLLGSTFNAAWRTPERLERQFDVCAQIAASVPVLDLAAPSDVTPPRLAAAVERAVAA